MTYEILSTRGRLATAGLILALVTACGGGSGGPTGNGNPPAVAGNYDATFTATEATGCQGFVTAPSSTIGTLRVTQSGSSVTLHISDLREEFFSNPVGQISTDGDFQFDGVVFIEPGGTTPAFEAEGTFDGMFSGSTMDIGFDFTAITCHVVGTIVGQRQ
jgi:hypothetical protein